MLSALRKILYPFSLIYHAITSIRNRCYDYNILKSKSFDIPVIVVGNLNVGGTGKTPMIEYFIRLLKADYTIATLSRGYRRKTKGFLLASETTTAQDIGDEPLQFYKKFGPEVHVAVDEERQRGILELQKQVHPEVILLDDAFQHRKVTAGFYVLLTTFNDAFVDDLILPAGNLRESRRGAKRADVVIVTKCPTNLSEPSKNKLTEKIKRYTEKDVPVLFSKIGYAKEIISDANVKPLVSLKERFSLVTGIANPKPLLDHLDSLALDYEHLKFSDHHNFTSKELSELAQKQFILTTEKDYVRLKDKGIDCYYLPITVDFIEGEQQLNTSILDFVMNGHKQENEA